MFSRVFPPDFHGFSVFAVFFCQKNITHAACSQRLFAAFVSPGAPETAGGRADGGAAVRQRACAALRTYSKTIYAPVLHKRGEAPTNTNGSCNTKQIPWGHSQMTKTHTHNDHHPPCEMERRHWGVYWQGHIPCLPLPSMVCAQTLAMGGYPRIGKTWNWFIFIYGPILRPATPPWYSPMKPGCQHYIDNIFIVASLGYLPSIFAFIPSFSPVPCKYHIGFYTICRDHDSINQHSHPSTTTPRGGEP